MAVPLESNDPHIKLYTFGTPNGQKVSITLEELGLKYETHSVDISKNIQKEEWFLKINPNGRIPAIVDCTPGPDGKAREKRVFDGGSIMLYLIQKYDQEGKISFPFDTDEYWEMVEWLMWMQTGIGPMQGQANHFYRYAPEKIPYGINRYQNETKRLYQVLDTRLAAQKAANGMTNSGPWIVGDKMTIADLACFSWVNWAEWAGIDVAEFKNVKDWQDRINARPAVQRGLDVPEPFEMKKKMQSKAGEEEFANMHSQWIMQGQKEEEEKAKK
ncbi:MAG: hypothetical protein M4579_007140 [Chaenotheca gracillima]|nr:MAG: hypothetical protein M4579_007140 [Chaenotheca gracillima]